jgi:putative ABC transport system substrate-binding protein
MRRKAFGAAASVALAALVAAPIAPEAQQPGKVARIGFLSSTPRAPSPHLREAFRQGMRDLGYVEGQNIVIEDRDAGGNLQRLRDLAAELARLNVAVIVTADTPAAQAAKQATTTIPIVMAASADPVGTGLVASLARPGGNVTGVSFLGPELVGKRLELLREVFPQASRVAVLWQPGSHGQGTLRTMLDEMEVAVRALGVQRLVLEAPSPGDIGTAFSTMAREHADALAVLPSAMFLAERRHIVDLAAKGRLPAMYYTREYVDAGGLMSYGASVADTWRRAATYVDKILKGAKPGDLPVEQPTKFELVINMKTAKALGLTFPRSVLNLADEAIQ